MAIKTITKDKICATFSDLIKNDKTTNGQIFFKSWTDGPSITPIFKNKMIKTQVERLKKLKVETTFKNVRQISDEVIPKEVPNQNLLSKPMAINPPIIGAIATSIGPIIGTLDL